MAYSTFTSPVAERSSLSRLLAAFVRGLSGLFNSFATAAMASSTGQARLDQAARLQAKSDAELAELGLKREDIVHHVFRDLFWT